MANPHAIAATLTAQKASAASANTLAMSPLTASYHQWVAGHQVGNALPRPLHDFLTGGFGPLEPILPMPIDEAGKDAERALPRRWQYQVGWNLPVGQPGQEGLKLAGFPALRTFADRYSVVRAMLNIRTNEMAGFTWDVGPTADAQSETKGDKASVKDQRERAKKIVSWFRKIDSNYYGFQSWFTSVLEDMHVCDNVSLHLLPTRVNGKGLFGSDLAEVEQLNGDTIRPLLDIRGATPRPPAPAYQQYLWGVPRSDLQAVMTDRDLEEMDESLRDAGVTGDIGDPEEEYRSDQLLYLPRLRRSWTPYGFGSIEQALIPISLGLNRQGFLLDYFTDGTIPGVYVIAGDQYATAAQQRQLQDTLNALAGDVAWKHRVIVLPPGSSTDPQKDLAWQKDVDQNIVEQVAMILHIQPHEIGMVPGGRTSGLGGKGMVEGQQDAVIEQRTNPDRKWWKETFFDWVIQRVFKQDDLEWKWLDFEEEEESSQKADSETKFISIGKASIDELRIEDGMDPWNLPLTKTPFVMMGGQLIPLDPTVPAPAPPAPGGVGPDGQPLPAGTPGAPPFGAKPAAPGLPGAKPPAAPGAKPGVPGAAKPGQPPVGATAPGTAPVAPPTKAAPFQRMNAVPADPKTLAKPAAPTPGPGSPAADETGTPIVHHDGSPATIHPDGGVSEPASGVLFSPDELDQILDVSDDEVEALLNEKQDAPPPPDDGKTAPKVAAVATKPGADPKAKAADEPKYIAGRLNAAYTTGATHDDIHAEVGAIRDRGAAATDGAKTPSNPTVIAQFQRNLSRKVRAAIIALAVKKFGRVPSATAVDATEKAWGARWLEKFTVAAQRELRTHNHPAHADAPAHEKVLAQMHLDHIARGQEQRIQDRRTASGDRRSKTKFAVKYNRRGKDDRRGADRRNGTAAAAKMAGPDDVTALELMTVADLVKGKVRYKGDLTPIVYRYLLRSYPDKVVKWVKDGEWEFDPHVDLSTINMARRPGGRNPDKVQAIGDSLDQGASMDPIVLVRRHDDSQYDYDIADGWHRTLGAEEAGWKDVPAFIGHGLDDNADWGLEMQDESDSVKKAAHAELAVLRRFLRKGGKVENFRTAAIDRDVMRKIETDLALSDPKVLPSIDAALTTAHRWVDKAGGNPQGLRDWYNEGADGQIDWGSDGDFMQCVGVASDHMDEEDAKGFCNLRHTDATGGAPGTEKNFSLSSPLSTGLVPYDLAGQQRDTRLPSATDPRCGVCGSFLVPGRSEGLDCPNGHGQQAFKYSDDELRDDIGRWSTGGDSAVANADEKVAAAALLAGKEPSVHRNEVAGVLSQFQPGTHDADLTELKVRGTLKFGGDGLGYARSQMPQIPAGQRDAFVRSLGVPVDQVDVRPQDLHPIQKEISCIGANHVLEDMRRNGVGSDRILVSKDNYVVDGHHHWAGATALSFEKDNVTIPIDRVGMDHGPLMDAALAWDRTQGIGLRDFDDKPVNKQLLAAIDAELARRGVILTKSETAHGDLHGWEHVEEGEQTKKGNRPDDMGPGIAGVSRDGKRYGVGVGKDEAGVFVMTHRARSKSYASMDDIPTSVLADIDATG